ncbi:MAG TPA: RNA polymerase subunit sigma-70 [Dehalococcoidia bacterium]|nr:RNA polymerase subunit sigma-70 [Dehalococcoidia bacterium]
MTPEGFEDLVRPYRRELAAHCYRMLGSLADAEDQVQETLLRAWRGIDGFAGRSSVKSWLYRIATNACLDMLRARPRRELPMEISPPHDPAKPLPATNPEISWLEPAPATLVGPDATFASRESVQLAFMTALQRLPAMQRAAVLLADVLEWQVAEIAELLESTPAAINSALQRARATLEGARNRPSRPVDRALLERYMQAWERGDSAAFAALLHEDVLVSMPPMPAWFRGRDAVVAFLAPRMVPGVQRIVPVDGADDVAFAFYRRAEDADYTARAIEVLLWEDGLVREIHAFFDRGLVERWGVPAILR